MLKSMTGFGFVSTETQNAKISIEIKSLNSKSLDLFLKLPKTYSDKEFLIRSDCSKFIERGKVSVNISVEYFNAEESAVYINQDLLKSYYNQLYEAAESLNANIEDLFSIAVKMPNVIKSQESVVDENEWNIIYNAFHEALREFNEFRALEGSALKNDLKTHTLAILNTIEEIEVFEPNRIDIVKDRIYKTISELIDSNKIDENRLEQELIYYIEKFDISEEKVRLRTHCNFFLECIEKFDISGKKLGFISQEMGREINTLGSKANDSSIQKLVVFMKEELEKIKEQLLNVQ